MIETRDRKVFNQQSENQQSEIVVSSEVGFGMKAGSLPQRRVAHAEARSHVFREELDGRAVSQGIGMGRVFHGLYEKALPPHVPGVRGALSALVAQAGSTFNRKSTSHVSIRELKH